ncbi:poly(rC)-binding protein 3 isoform X2 [Nilaparvata lugens]|uniref:poly(rC)-binding protein 3 isoform X2 n=1 Tax=Nilaparvata lugens TaxID=108931 RepID=UPI00193EB12A|nr:poly(rC)-binding protein 3 isoform X2 [Nilaparvata lugens]XP_039290010.1 poly(rC)-binding protein 3 isoform X2 [Nilaparvata lugens]
MDDLKTFPNDDPSVTLTIRLIMQGKEVGSIIGRKGEIVKRFRDESGAKINISDGSCPERVVTVTGPTNAIFKAFTLICKKFEEFQEMQNGGGGGGGGGSRTPITIRLIVPASQCGSLIGKGGSKIKEIREVTGASIQVASDMLPHSTERAVTITGTSDAITQCIYHICCVMLESPPKGATIPYRPKPQVAGPVIVAGGQAYTIQGNYAVPTHGDVSSPLAAGPPGGPLGVPHLGGVPFPPAGLVDPLIKNGHLQAALPPPHLEIGKMGGGPLAGLAALGLGANTGGLNQAAALAALAGSQLRSNTAFRNQQNTNQQTHEMTVPNDLIGCIIGKGGTKIAEIRQISGAMIRISNCEERDGNATDRTITITGTPDSVALAQYLINMSVELQKANLEGQNADGGAGGGSDQEGGSGGGGSGGGGNSLNSTIPIAQLLAKHGALSTLASALGGGLTDLLGGISNHSPPIQTTGVHRSRSFGQRMRSPGGGGGPSRSPATDSKFSKDRKFQPY